MILERLSIARCEWEYEGRVKGRYYGDAVFDSPLGKVQINLQPEAATAILGICAGQVIAASKEVARAMADDVVPPSDWRTGILDPVTGTIKLDAPKP